MSTRARSGAVHRGWYGLGAGFVSSVILVGATIYSFGLYVVPVGEEFGLARAQMNVGHMLFTAAIALWSPFVGALLDRVPAAAAMCAGGALLAIGFGGMASASSLAWVCVAIAGPLALAMALAGPLAASTVVAKWFRRRRGRALGIVAVSTATGGLVMTPITAWLIGRHGWRGALAITGVCGAVVIVGLAAAFVRSRPTEEQLREGGEIDDDAPAAAAALDARAWPLRDLLASRNFWLLALGAGLLISSDGAILISKVPYLLDIGIDAQSAAFLVSVQSLSALTGKLAVGFAAERYDVRRLFGAMAVAHLVMLAVLLAKPSYWTLFTVFALVGVAIGGVHPVFTMLVALAFGAGSYGAVHGRINVVTMPLMLGASYFIGRVHDDTGSYDAAFWTFGVLVLVAALLVGGMRLDGDRDEGDVARRALAPARPA
ncbi:MAG: MFS transporter [Myxococcota bacterium]|nr:MFS transporter [Myxococcales bacterium]